MLRRSMWILNSIFLILIVLFTSSNLFSQVSGDETKYYYENLSLKNGFPSSQVYQIFEDDKGFKWFITDRGVVQYDGHDVKVYTTEDGLADLVNFTIVAENENTFRLQGSKGRLSYWNGNQFHIFKFNDKIEEHYKNENGYVSLLCVKKDYLVFGTDENSIRIDRKSGKISSIKYRFEKASLKQNLRPFWIENWGHSELVSINNRLKKAIGEAHKVVSITQFDSTPNWYGLASTTGAHLINSVTNEHLIFFPSAQTNSVYQDKNGGVWITTYDKGVYCFPSLLIKRLELPNEGLNESYKKFIKLNDNLIIQPFESNLYLVTPYAADFIKYFRTNVNLMSKLNNRIFSMEHEISEKEGQLNLKAHKEKIGYAVYNLENGDTLVIGASSLHIKNKKILFQVQSINKNHCFKEESTKKFWFGDKFGLRCFTKSEGKYNVEKVQLSSKNKFVRINDIEVDKFGNVWIATLENGVILIRDEKIIPIKHSKLLSSAIHNLYLENDHTLWIATNSGLNKLIYKPKSDNIITKIETFTTYDGLLSNFINDITFWNDKLYLATDHGVCLFDPKKVPEYTGKPKLEIFGLYINNLNANFLGIKSEFKSNENDIRFVVNGITKNIPLGKSKFYRYRLRNSKDENWKHTNSPNITFSNLPHGKYTFELQCQTINQVWSDSAMSSFEIKPHIFETWWFKFLIIIGLILLISFLIYFKLESNHKKAKQLLMTKKSELAVLTNQMNPHFIFNTMNAIESFVLSQKPLIACEYIGKFSALMRKSIAYSSMEYIPIENEVTFMEKYLELEKLRFGDHFEYTIDNQLDENVQIPPLLAQPLVENSIKHAFKGMKGNGLLELSYSLTADKCVVIRIKDNGVGFDPSLTEKSDSYGLNIIKERLRINNIEAKNKKYSIEINSAINNMGGTIVELRIPFKLN